MPQFSDRTIIAFFESLFISLFLSGIVLLILNVVLLCFSRKFKKTALEKNHHVVAELQRVIHAHGVDNGDFDFREKGIYTYIVNGRKYTYSAWYAGRPNDTVDLYWLSRPSRACPEDKLGKLGCLPSLLIYILVTAIVFVSLLV